jgi:alpha-mannosidase
MKRVTLPRARRLPIRSLAAALFGAWLSVVGSACAQTFLWQIGVRNTNDTEFALAPGGYAQYPTAFPNDAIFTVGQSNASTAWPYVEPGPADAWAGSRQHTFTVLFGLQSAPTNGTCQADFDLLDTQSVVPPQLNITVNGQSYSQTLPAGAGDASVMGNPAAGKEFKFSVPFPVSLLRSGLNQIGITTVSGSWFLYDWLGLETPAGTVLTNVSSATVITSVQPSRALIQTNGSLFTPTQVTLSQVGSAADGTLQIGGASSVPVHLSGAQTVAALAPDVPAQTNVLVTLTVGGQVVASQSITLLPVRHLTIYALPHSHHDIGFTDLQGNVAIKQVNNLVQAIQYARQTATNPPGARFIWNEEVLWGTDLYLNSLDAQARADLLNAVTNGQVELNGMYLNELTGLCRPEELLRLFRYSTKLADLTGVPIESAMISDVPGYTWGTVTALAQAGIKYFSIGPNGGYDGYLMQDWPNRPFYWVGPDGHSKVLAWIPLDGYYSGSLSQSFVNNLINSLDQINYPYDITYVRQSGGGDNAVPDPSICDFVKNWNAQYAYPRIIISGTTEAFHAFEQRYSNSIPVHTGDWTPYWEDGAGSSALETGMNRNSADRLTQAETLFAMLNPAAYSPAAFESAWTNVLLYSEHTWGAWCSVSQPDSPFTLQQWAVKQGFALQAAGQSSNLLLQAQNSLSGSNAPPSTVDVFNTLSWVRSELVLLPPALSSAGDRVLDDQGRPVLSQRLSTGELALLASNVPPMAARRFTVAAGPAYAPAPASRRVIAGFGGSFLGLGTAACNAIASPIAATLDNGKLHVRLDAVTGGITELTAAGIAGNLADTSDGETVNDYRYQLGTSMPTTPMRNGSITITAGETGPLVASLVVQSSAPGCNSLRREVRLVAGQDYVQLNNLLDKTRVASGYFESVNFAFPFNIPGGSMLLDLPLGAMRPEFDQMLDACKNWLTIGRWADITNADCGLTWVTLDAPLIEVGSITATLFGSQHNNPALYLRTNDPKQKLYSWAMSNNWDMNYRAYQTGQTSFRYLLRPHLPYAPIEATRFALAFSQPLLPVSARTVTPASTPLLQLGSPDITVLTLKPSDDGAALIVHLFGASGKDAIANLIWAQTPARLWLSNTSEKPLTPISGPVTVPAWGVVTLRADMH